MYKSGGAGLNTKKKDEGAGRSAKKKDEGAGRSGNMYKSGGGRRATRWVKVNLGGEEMNLYCDTGSNITIIVAAHLGSPLVLLEVPVCLVVSHPGLAALLCQVCKVPWYKGPISLKATQLVTSELCCL